MKKEYEKPTIFPLDVKFDLLLDNSEETVDPINPEEEWTIPIK